MEFGKTILIVDDDPVQVQSLSRGLKARGYQILSATNADEAMMLITDKAIAHDLLLADLKMSRVDVFEMLRLLRESGLARPTILMTAGQAKYLEKPGPEQLYSAVLEKPFSLDILIREIDRSLSAFADHKTPQ